MSDLMQEDVGTVVQVKGNWVKVEVVRSGGCKTCSMRGMCFGRNTPAVFDLKTELELQEGDRVALEIAPGTRIVSALLVFGTPMIFLFAGFLISKIWLQELPAIGVAFTATLLSFLVIKFIDRKMGSSFRRADREKTMIIRLNDMVFYGYHGIHDEERKLGQRFVVTVELHSQPEKDQNIKHLNDTIDYTRVYAEIKEIMETHQFYILEACANTLADKLLDDYPLLSKIVVRIQKPSVPIQGILSSVEVELSRSRP